MQIPEITGRRYYQRKSQAQVTCIMALQSRDYLGLIFEKEIVAKQLKVKDPFESRCPLNIQAEHLRAASPLPLIETRVGLFSFHTYLFSEYERNSVLE